MGAAAIGLWLTNLLLDTVGQLAFKVASSQPSRDDTPLQHWRAMLGRPWIWLGVACYSVEFFTWLAFLTLMPLSVAVLLATVNIATVAVAGWWFLGERAGGWRVAGIALVAFGAALVGAG